jgi:hypothetical protein
MELSEESAEAYSAATGVLVTFPHEVKAKAWLRLANVRRLANGTIIFMAAGITRFVCLKVSLKSLWLLNLTALLCMMKQEVLVA